MPNEDGDNLCFVLVGTTHPGNIGAAARAMKSMGMRRLVLVQPKHFPCAEATAMASGADDLLAEAEVWGSLADALHDYTTVVATSARQRHIDWPEMDPRRCATEVARLATQQRVAIVFGREHSGLTNDELEYCSATVRIPTVSGFSSLNLAAAVQILAYEIYLARRERVGAQPTVAQTPRATTEAMVQLYAHLQQTMTDVGFYDPQKPRRLMRRLRRLFNRAGIDEDEVQILRGFLSAVQGMQMKVSVADHPRSSP